MAMMAAWIFVVSSCSPSPLAPQSRTSMVKVSSGVVTPTDSSRVPQTKRTTLRLPGTRPAKYEECFAHNTIGYQDGSVVPAE